MAGAMLGNSNIARQMQEEALGSPLEDEDSQSSSSTPAPPAIVTYLNQTEK